MNKRLLTLEDIISGYVIQGDPILASLLREADMRPDAVLYVISIKDRVFEYTSKTVSRLIGYSSEEFRLGGADFFFKILHKDVIHDVIKKQVELSTRTKNPTFNPCSEIVDEFYTPIISPDQTIIPLASLTTFLLFTADAEVEYTIGLLCENNDQSIAECKALLLAIKRRHNEIYTHQRLVDKNNPLNLIYLTSEQIDKKITIREAEVLLRIANGLSTEEISKALNISSHTVETHRKSLLVKFDAKNSAELIKKTSKVFWLE